MISPIHLLKKLVWNKKDQDELKYIGDKILKKIYTRNDIMQKELKKNWAHVK